MLTTPFSPIPSSNQTLQTSTQWCPFSTCKLMPPIVPLSAVNLYLLCLSSLSTPPCLQLLQGYCISSSVCLNALSLTLVSTAPLHSFSQTQGYILQDHFCAYPVQGKILSFPLHPLSYYCVYFFIALITTRNHHIYILPSCLLPYFFTGMYVPQ